MIPTSPAVAFDAVATAGLSQLVTDTGAVMTGVMTWVSSVVSGITSSPLLLIGVAVGLAGTAVGITRKLLRTRV